MKPKIDEKEAIDFLKSVVEIIQYRYLRQVNFYNGPSLWSSARYPIQ